jgi:hypothetical protein
VKRGHIHFGEGEGGERTTTLASSTGGLGPFGDAKSMLNFSWRSQYGWAAGGRRGGDGETRASDGERCTPTFADPPSGRGLLSCAAHLRGGREDEEDGLLACGHAGFGVRSGCRGRHVGRIRVYQYLVAYAVVGSLVAGVWLWCKEMRLSRGTVRAGIYFLSKRITSLWWSRPLPRSGYCVAA